MPLPLPLVPGCCLPWCVMRMFSCMAGNHFSVKGVGHLILTGKGRKVYFFFFEVKKIIEEGWKETGWVDSS